MATDTMEKPAAGAARRIPDFSTMSKADMLASFAGTVDNSDWFGKGPGPEFGLRVTRKELGAAVAQIKGEEPQTLVDNEGQRKAVVDSLRTFFPAVKDAERTKGPPGKGNPETGVVFTGIAGLENIAGGFGNGPTRVVRLDKDMMKDIMGSVSDRSAMHDSLTALRSAKSFSIVRQKAFDRSRSEARAKAKAGAAER